MDDQLHSLFGQLHKPQVEMHGSAVILIPGTDALVHANYQGTSLHITVPVTTLECALAYIDLCQQLAQLCGRDKCKLFFFRQ